ncbi:hypothetical protein J3R82DRAFT_9833 [Butyriboletus roseoflavus]|nr:hypothetical protein J3R82DRAFT_9833 [Butyriboletus roseoflavus]
MGMSRLWQLQIRKHTVSACLGVTLFLRPSTRALYMSLDAYRSEIAQYFTEAVAADDALVKECKRVRDLPQSSAHAFL